ncbi:MAG: c-type cytochrome [Verrucomicrobia bacterium]|nr:c-type cytochrome [Verrucomicrobiota bacterium]
MEKAIFESLFLEVHSGGSLFSGDTQNRIPMNRNAFSFRLASPLCLLRMVRQTAFSLIGLAAMQMLLLAGIVRAAEIPNQRPYGLNQRVPWTSSRVKGTPEPPAPYRTELAFAKLKFTEPLIMATAPGSDRLFVAERFGKIYSFANDAAAEKTYLLIDIGRGEVYGLAFHPKFQENGFFYVTYVEDAKRLKEGENGSRLSRFQMKQDGSADLSSEKIILIWPHGGHNGGCIVFGPDNYLYLATGDGSGIADELETGQKLDDLLGAILRIDVDHADEGLAYGIPKDNPFVNVKGARPEIWAYGLRQPWKITFDRGSGDLWTGNVGQDLWEQVYKIERGGNYGWSVTEGSHPFRPERPKGPSPILLPIVEHDHTAFRSITGGYVYRGSRLKELIGSFIYGDYDTGKIWALRYSENKVADHRELFDSPLRLVGFGEDKAGELYLIDHMGGGIHRLVANEAAARPSEFPRKLSESGLFASVQNHTPAPGVIPFSVIAPMWSDGAQKERFLALPGESKIEFDGITYPQPSPGAPHGWKFPDGTVLAETISLEMEKGNPASRRRVETRILHHERVGGSENVGDQIWHGYSYVWNDEQTEATLLENPQGVDRTFAIRDADAPGGQRQQTWHVPGRTECIVCHNMAAKYALGVNTLQMNRDHKYSGVTDNQLRTLEHIGAFEKPLPARPEELPRLVNYADRTQSLSERARSYLHANCAHCHRKWGGGNADFKLLYGIGVGEMGIVNTRANHGDFYISHASLVSPGDAYRSVLFYRMSKLGSGRMPRLGSTLVDEVGVQLIHDWIEQLPSVAEAEEALRTLRTQTGGTNEAHAIDQLLASTSGALRALRALEDGSLRGAARKKIIERAATNELAHVRDLFERFVPEEQRIRRLGSVIQPHEILALPGDVERGRQIFFGLVGTQCRNCHQINGQGTALGPDLSQIGKKFNRPQLLEAILTPSKDIDPKYAGYTLDRKDGESHSGFLVSKTEEKVVLRDTTNRTIEVPANQVERLAVSKVSLMPELLLRDMTARQVADLTEFLGSLK